MKFIFLLHCLCTVLMTGVIWLVQVVHYPLFTQVGEIAFESYHPMHIQYISYLVMPLMLIELFTALYFAYQPPSFLYVPVYWYFGLLLLGIIWGATFLIQVPQHQLLSNGFNADVCHQLVMGNWIRTIAWTVRTILMAYFIYCLLD